MNNDNVKNWFSLLADLGLNKLTASNETLRRAAERLAITPEGLVNKLRGYSRYGKAAPQMSQQLDILNAFGIYDVHYLCNGEKYAKPADVREALRKACISKYGNQTQAVRTINTYTYLFYTDRDLFAATLDKLAKDCDLCIEVVVELNGDTIRRWHSGAWTMDMTNEYYYSKNQY